MSETVLEVENLTVDIPIASGMLHPVRGISFSVQKGETLCIVGESGCGKSLTSLAMMGLLPKTAQRRTDKLIFRGEEIGDLPERQMSKLRGGAMSMIFQEPMTSLNPAYTIGDQLMEVFRRHNTRDRAVARDRAVYLLEKVGISSAASRLSQYPHQLSGGLRQRVMIAMALMCEPELIIADEPTTALDVTIQAQILHLLAELQDEFDMGLILITHDLGVVARIADKVQVMYAGRTVEEGPVNAIFEEPAHPYTQGLLRCIPVPGKTKRGERLGSVPGIVPNLVGDLEGCMFRNRCPYAIAECDTAGEQLVELPSGDHAHACIRSMADRAAIDASSTEAAE
jgi:peptide/nickel transport system ATP-binding protein